MTLNKTDAAWANLFDKYKIVDEIDQNKIFTITAEQIKEIREPRLMTKFDWSASRPKLFKENNLCILPNSRGTYVIGKFKAYQKLNYQEKKPIRVALPDYISSFNNFSVTSESVALNLAKMSGMIDIVMGRQGEEPLAVDTISGRLKSGKLRYNIDIKDSNKPFCFDVSNSQVEIDAGFENLNNLAIIEAKNRIPQDFMIRQLYYPYQIYRNLNTGKQILPIYFTHADDIYAFHIFEFTDPNNYSSLKLVKQVNFIIDQNLDITIQEVKKISEDSSNTQINIAFPQADIFTRVLDIMQHLNTPKDKNELATAYDFDERQGDYYGNALRYLGFVSKNNSKFELTPLGKRVAEMPNNNTRNRIIIEKILSDKIFNEVFINTLSHRGEFDNDFIDHTLLRNTKSVGTMVTAKRRRSTVQSWITWILEVVTAE
ncbi:type II restriction enzyme [Leuconostoc fallax]|uniref:type II restriction enzyme n=1 Tax=Leuconostoc fallax TaxID=1251 RepID=UPI001C1EFD29|nr:hypothetical protein [Leuconostoc fallax]MBU7455858.1 hypothetical protein [Leuconostoc fallax]